MLCVPRLCACPSSKSYPLWHVVAAPKLHLDRRSHLAKAKKVLHTLETMGWNIHVLAVSPLFDQLHAELQLQQAT